MIVTLTINPSLDRTLDVDVLERGGLNRVRTRVDPGGKGVNVTRVLHVNGVASIAVFPVGGSSGRELVRLLHDEGIEVVTVPIRDAVRSNVSVVEADGTVTKLNESGPRLTGDEVPTLATTALGLMSADSWLVVSGSLPPGVPQAIYTDIVSGARDMGGRVALDSSDEAHRGHRSGPNPGQTELVRATGTSGSAPAYAGHGDRRSAFAAGTRDRTGSPESRSARRQGSWMQPGAC